MTHYYYADIIAFKMQLFTLKSENNCFYSTKLKNYSDLTDSTNMWLYLKQRDTEIHEAASTDA